MREKCSARTRKPVARDMEVYERTRFVTANPRSIGMFFPIPLEMKRAETGPGIPGGELDIGADSAELKQRLHK